MKKSIMIGMMLSGSIFADVDFPLRRSVWNEVQLEEVATNLFNKPIFMTKDEAAEYCRDHGSRLPTTRELAAYAQGLGALIRDTSYPDKDMSLPFVQKEIAQMFDENFYSISTKNSAGGMSVDFYYRPYQYKTPVDEVGNDFYYWSLSGNPRGAHMAVVLSGEGGNILELTGRYDDFHSVARCLKKVQPEK